MFLFYYCHLYFNVLYQIYLPQFFNSMGYDHFESVTDLGLLKRRVVWLNWVLVNGDFSIYLKSCIGMMLSERHSCIQGQDGQRAQSFTRRRNRKGHSHVVSTCCVADNLLGAFTRVTLAADFSPHAVNEPSLLLSTCVLLFIRTFLWTTESLKQSFQRCPEWYSTSLNPPRCCFHIE